MTNFDIKGRFQGDTKGVCGDRENFNFSALASHRIFEKQLKQQNYDL